MTITQKTVFTHWVREMIGSNDIDGIVTFVEGTNAEKLETLKAFALAHREALVKDKAKYEARVADRAATLAAMDAL